jgi:GNAT superfamily N-acetyltransferase
MDETIRIGIRLARPEDAAAIASIYVDSWRDTYAGILPASGLLKMSKADQTAGWTRTIKHSNLRNPVLVASDDKSRIYGFASAGVSRDKSLPYEGEIYALYVAPGRTGQGMGTALMSSVFRLFSKANYGGIVIWALAANPSRFFYEAMGGQLIAERHHPMWGETLREAGYGWSKLDIAGPRARVGRGVEEPEPPLG